MTILKKIVNNRLSLLEIEKSDLPFIDIKKKVEELSGNNYKPENFLKLVKRKKPFLIAEIKKGSPSKGIIRGDFNVIDIAKEYENSNHVNALSILTEPDFFYGSYEYVEQAKMITNKPVLMKDFIIDPYQIYKGFIIGASAFLVIASITEDRKIHEFIKIAKDLNMSILFEAHSISEYKRALKFDIDMVGINNRDLKTFKTDINNTISILKETGKPDEKTIISESGIHSKDDVQRLWSNGVDGFLIGEKFMKHNNIGESIDELFGD